MPYRLKQGEPVPAGVRRIVREQIERAVAEADDMQLPREQAIHQARKRCKKIRAVLRLVRGPMEEDGAYQRENAWYRDAAGRLSRVRDAQVLVTTCDRLLAELPESIDRRTFTPIRQHLVQRGERIASDEEDPQQLLEGFRREVREALRRIPSWPLTQRGFDSLEFGLSKTYGRAYKGLAAAYKHPTGGGFHEWRKRVKYHWYHIRILQDLWTPVLEARCGQADALGELLGQEHDLQVLRQILRDESDRFGHLKGTPRFLALIERRRQELHRAARPLGERLFAEKPKHLVRRWRIWWEQWEEVA